MPVKAQKGFTLIEVIVVVAVIGILAAIAIPNYIRHSGKAKVLAALAELAAIKPNVEDWVNNSTAALTLSAVGVNATQTTNCNISLVSSDAGQTLSCSLVNPPYFLTGGILTLTLSSSGVWSCSVNGGIGTDFTPAGCQNAN